MGSAIFCRLLGFPDRKGCTTVIISSKASMESAHLVTGSGERGSTGEVTEATGTWGESCRPTNTWWQSSVWRESPPFGSGCEADLELLQEQQPPEPSQPKDDYPRSDLGSCHWSRRDPLLPSDKKYAPTFYYLKIEFLFLVLLFSSFFCFTVPSCWLFCFIQIDRFCLVSCYHQR